MTTKRHRTVALGGTFDHLHKGHRALLARAFELGAHVLIGVTSDEFARRLRPGERLDHSYQQRVTKLTEFLQQSFPGGRYTIAKLDDYFGPAVLTGEVEAMVVSAETKPRLRLANRLRASRGLRPLRSYVVPLVMADDNKPISSTRIRRGEIDAEGRLLRPTRT